MNFEDKSRHLKKMNRLLWMLGAFKIRMISFVMPKVVDISNEKVVMKIPFNRRTKNHLNSIYLGAFAVGADLVSGLPIAYMAREEKTKISLAFKNMSSQYYKRATSTVFFEVKNMRQFVEMLSESKQSGERVTKDIPVEIYTHYGKEEQELVAEFVMGLSIKVVG